MRSQESQLEKFQALKATERRQRQRRIVQQESFRNSRQSQLMQFVMMFTVYKFTFNLFIFKSNMLKMSHKKLLTHFLCCQTLVGVEAGWTAR